MCSSCANTQRTKDQRDFSIPQVVTYFGNLNRQRRPAVNLYQFETLMKGGSQQLDNSPRRSNSESFVFFACFVVQSYFLVRRSIGVKSPMTEPILRSRLIFSSNAYRIRFGHAAAFSPDSPLYNPILPVRQASCGRAYCRVQRSTPCPGNIFNSVNNWNDWNPETFGMGVRL